MFTGIIETTGKVISLKKKKSNLEIGIETSFAKELKEGQSIAHNGVCLTVERLIPSDKKYGVRIPSDSPSPKEKGARSYIVTAVKETLDKTNLGSLKKGSIVNLERSLKVGDRLDGHFVQGHVDCTTKVKSIKKKNGSRLLEFRIKNQESRIKNLIIEKGSVCINGVSLTVVDSKLRTPNSELEFSVAIIPHTFSHTNFCFMKTGDEVNIEFDVLGKHIEKILSSRQ